MGCCGCINDHVIDLCSRGSAEHGNDAASDFLGRAELNNTALDCFKKELMHDYDQPLGRRQPMTEARSSPGAAASSMSSAESATGSVTPVQENPEQARGNDDALQMRLRRGQASSAQLATVVKVQPFQDVPQKLLYKLVEPDSGGSVVKFATCYSEEAHRSLAAQRLAPELLGVKELPGGWCQIHMELLDAPWCSLLELLRSNEP